MAGLKIPCRCMCLSQCGAHRIVGVEAIGQCCRRGGRGGEGDHLLIRKSCRKSCESYGELSESCGESCESYVCMFGPSSTSCPLTPPARPVGTQPRMRRATPLWPSMCRARAPYTRPPSCPADTPWAWSHRWGGAGPRGEGGDCRRTLWA